MTRRTLGLLVTFALALQVMPLRTDAQQPTKVYRIDRLNAGSSPEVSPFI
ncbi:MAG TPA: hypothetical protein VE844_09900 [Gammaproteobacteria bacterium]|jgi:hypothetical protein|nr:hypothetical protein [Gammaproteobacteria bacterium]